MRDNFVLLQCVLPLITAQLSNSVMFPLKDLFVFGHHHLAIANIFELNLHWKNNPFLWKQYDNAK